MIKEKISNFILSRVDIGNIKHAIAANPVFLPLFKVFSQGLIDYDFPSHIFIESTRACNLKCKSCPRDKFCSGGGHMDMTIFRKIIDEAGAFGRRNFCLHMLGEPLMNPALVEMVSYIKKANPGHCVLLTTNGYLMDERRAKGLILAGLDKAAFSIFSLQTQKNLELTGRGDIDTVIANIRVMAILRRKNRAATKIYVRFLVSNENAGELEDMRALAKKLGVYFEARKTHNYTGVIKNDCTSETVRGLRHPCYHPWFSPAVTWDGKMVLCCSDWNNSTMLGDVSKESISAIWNGPLIKEFRRAHLNADFGKISLCRNCNVWALYPDIFFKAQKKKAQNHAR